MKVRLNFKTPYVVDAAADDMEDDGVSKDDIGAFKAVCKKWVEYDEYLTVEIDTETGECIPIKVGE